MAFDADRDEVVGYVVLYGDLTHGFKVYGVFNNEKAARRYAEGTEVMPVNQATVTGLTNFEVLTGDGKW